MTLERRIALVAALAAATLALPNRSAGQPAPVYSEAGLAKGIGIPGRRGVAPPIRETIFKFKRRAGFKKGTKFIALAYFSLQIEDNNNNKKFSKLGNNQTTIRIPGPVPIGNNANWEPLKAVAIPGIPPPRGIKYKTPRVDSSQALGEANGCRARPQASAK